VSLQPWVPSRTALDRLRAQANQKPCRVGTDMCIPTDRRFQGRQHNPMPTKNTDLHSPQLTENGATTLSPMRNSEYNLGRSAALGWKLSPSATTIPRNSCPHVCLIRDGHIVVGTDHKCGYYAHICRGSVTSINMQIATAQSSQLKRQG
jgi:hypothetical protein